MWFPRPKPRLCSVCRSPVNFGYFLYDERKRARTGRFCKLHLAGELKKILNNLALPVIASVPKNYCKKSAMFYLSRERMESDRSDNNDIQLIEKFIDSIITDRLKPVILIDQGAQRKPFKRIFRFKYKPIFKCARPEFKLVSVDDYVKLFSTYLYNLETHFGPRGKNCYFNLCLPYNSEPGMYLTEKV